ncbi:hypothetical protein FD755_001598 [Muntiacus reevesi]|uniref:Uncharacterized protein n=1 Tax=Muntiacus reevesi TaxID=9886 RepID=A0A5J5N339_MUNRE|nr:hypothetical protein FD755_001598 [Muntiacus reevesi]
MDILETNKYLHSQLEKKCEEYKGTEFERQFVEGHLVMRRFRHHMDPEYSLERLMLKLKLQKIQEGKGVCYLFTQLAKNTVKIFESLRQKFCELLAQGNQLVERLASKLTIVRSGSRGREPGLVNSSITPKNSIVPLCS